jgi:hypothetical protein
MIAKSPWLNLCNTRIATAKKARSIMPSLEDRLHGVENTPEIKIRAKTHSINTSGTIPSAIIKGDTKIPRNSKVSKT